MKKIKIMGYLFLYILFSINVNAQATSPEQLVVPLSSPGKSYTLKVGLMNGSIKVNSYGGKDIQIDVSTGNRNRNENTEDAGGGMKRISPKNSYDVTASEDNNIITVNSDNFNKSLSLSLKIPQDVKLKLSTVNQGDIEVDNVKGELEINNVNGAIKLTNISGSVVATTVNGDIVVTFNDVDTKAPMAFTTLNGRVDITFPANAKSNLTLKSDRGEIYTDFDIQIDKTEPKVKIASQPGLYQLKLDDWVKGKINGGGSEILMKNMQGNIYIRKAK